MKFSVFPAVLVILSEMLCSQVQSKPSSYCSVSGRVVRADSGDPVRSARVVLIQAESARQARTYSVFSDEKGLFSMTEIPPGRYRFAAGRAGFITQQYQPDPISGSGALLELSSCDQVDEVLFRLRPAAVISGTVSDEGGEPLAGVEVTALKDVPSDPVDNNRNVAPMGKSVTNDLGEYRIYALPAGDYYVAAIDSGAPVLTDQNPSGFNFTAATGQATDHPPMYYPGVFRLHDAQKLHVGAGGTSRVDLTLRAVESLKVSGRVLSENGQPAAGAYVFLAPRDLGGISSLRDSGATTDAQGSFSMPGILPGSYELYAAEEQGPFMLSAEMQMELGNEDRSGILLRLERGVSLAGRVLVEGAGSQSLDLSSLRIWLSHPGNSAYDSSVAEVKKNGVFNITDLRRSAYALHVTGLPEGWYVQSAHLGMTDALADGVAPGNEASEPLEVTLSSKAADLSGTVTFDQKPAPGAIVRVIPAHPSAFHRDLFKKTVTDQHGQFVLHGLAPGNYQIQATAAPDADISQDRESPIAPTVTENANLMDGSKKTVALILERQ